MAPAVFLQKRVVKYVYSYVRLHFVEGFSDIVKPLYQLTHQVFVVGQAHPVNNILIGVSSSIHIHTFTFVCDANRRKLCGPWSSS